MSGSAEQLDYYDAFLSKIQDLPAWSPAQEQILTEPFEYLATIPGKEIRSALIDAFDDWLHVDANSLSAIKRIVGMLHNASLLMDDVEDNSLLRRGQPVAHKIYGIPQTLNSANYVYFLAFRELQRIRPVRLELKVEEMVTDELLNLHRGQGMDLFWRENLICPTEEEYIAMVNNKTGGLFRIAIKLMMTSSASDVDFVPLVNLVGVIFQIRDDYVNLQSEAYATNKGYCEDLSEGKFSFPIVHSIRADSSNRQVLKADPKRYAVEYMDKQTKSFEYTRQVLDKLMAQARGEVKRLGGNAKIERILDLLEIEKP